MAPRIVALLAVAAVTLAACGSSSSSSTSDTTATSSSPGARPLVQIRLANVRFVPVRATVHVGQRVTWVNEDSVDHNVTATSGAHFRSSTLQSGDTYVYRPRAPGRIAYVCTIHPGMRGLLIVRR